MIVKPTKKVVRESYDWTIVGLTDHPYRKDREDVAFNEGLEVGLAYHDEVMAKLPGEKKVAEIIEEYINENCTGDVIVKAIVHSSYVEWVRKLAEAITDRINEVQKI